MLNQPEVTAQTLKVLRSRADCIVLAYPIHESMMLFFVTEFLNKPLSETGEKCRKAEEKISRIAGEIKAGKIIRDGRRWYSRTLGFFVQRDLAMLTMYKLRSAVKIHRELCVQCNTCIALCPVDNLYSDNGKTEQKNKCTLCCRCVNECPAKAISIFLKRAPKVQYTRKDYN